MTRRKAETGAAAPFWKTVPLGQMTPAQWESLCDGCGRCCLEKLEDEDSGDIYFTDIACRLLDSHSCQCSRYRDRFRFVPDCVQLTPRKVPVLPWLPPTCAYRLIEEGKDLYWWHPLVSGDPDSVHGAGVSVRGRIGPRDNEVPVEDWETRLVSWPGQFPAKARARAAKKSG